MINNEKTKVLIDDNDEDYIFPGFCSGSRIPTTTTTTTTITTPIRVTKQQQNKTNHESYIIAEVKELLPV